ncbi:MAG: DNA polymerase III subunit gamma/tau, partial [Desulfobulbales bacterium]|nr:DNA polymerase III subunit gamma/tau [Desulfobulbales bacterium]
ATTELHKIPITILSRCQRYELKKVASRDLFEFFSRIAKEEKVRISDWALNIIVREAGGSVRDGLSLLDQILSFGGEEISDEDVVQVLGLVDSQVISSMAAAILEGDLATGLKILDETSSYGVDLKRLANDLLYYFRALVICRISDQPEKLLDIPDQEFAEMRATAAQHSAETLQLYFNMLLKGTEEMQYSTHPRLAFEMALIRSAEAGNVVPVAELIGRLEALQPGEIAAPPKKETVSRTPAPKPVARKKAKSVPAEQTGNAAVSPVPGKQKNKGARDSKVKEPPEKKPVKPAAQKSSEHNVSEDISQPPTKDVRKNWDEFIEYVMDRKKWMAHTLRLCATVREEDSDLQLKFDDPSDCKMLQTKENIKFLTEFSQDFFQKEFKVVIKVWGDDSEGVPDHDTIGPQEERRALANDPLVQMATDVLGGRVVNIRTGPRSR